MTVIYLVRHGQTYFNRYNKMQGWSDSPLTQQGIHDAQRIGKIFENTRFSYIASSDAHRARQTAQIIIENNNCNKLKVHEIPEFRESFYGYFEGNDAFKTWFIVGQKKGYKTFKALVSKYGFDQVKDFMNEADPFHEAETSFEYWRRINKAFKILSEHVSDETNNPILLVTHGTTIRSIVDHYAPKKFPVIAEQPSNGSITTIILDSLGQIKVKSYNKLTID
ncbi:MAG: histidine phosphatase family protein [Bombilactobacillus mellifer]|nr:histidine phosphatase family protein [Bombilactobacillus mellifer]